MKVNLIVILSAILLLLGCSKNEKRKKDDLSFLENTKEINLEKETTRFKIPNNYKKTSRYRIKQDIPRLKEDSVVLFITQRELEALEFQDSEIDIYVDTISKYHTIIFINLRQFSFSIDEANLLNKIVSDEFKALDEQISEIEIVKLESNFRRSKNWEYMKFKFHFKNLIEPKRSVYKTAYFLTTDRQSYVIIEYSETEDDLEKYLWTIKE